MEDDADGGGQNCFAELHTVPPPQSALRSQVTDTDGRCSGFHGHK
jgi:hypothetical protein